MDRNCNPRWQPTSRRSLETPPENPPLGALWRSPIDGAEMVYVPAGPFVMGTRPERLGDILELCGVPSRHVEGFRDETPAKTVQLPGFWIDRLPATNRQYAQFLESSGFLDAPEVRHDRRFYERRILHGQTYGADFPAGGLSWFEAKALCAWAGKRLPSEAEWEKAARGADDERIFPWGDNVDLSRMNVMETSRLMPDGNTVDLDSPNRSPCGCLDMVGNVGEWCEDWYDADGYPRGPAEVPTGPDHPAGQRAVRGGRTDRLLVFARCAARDCAPPHDRVDFVGVRGVWVG